MARLHWKHRSHLLAMWPVLFVAAAVLTGCSGSGPKPSADSNAGPATAVTEVTSPDEPATTMALPPGAMPGLDDYDGDGQLDPTCGTQDFGAGLVLRIPCKINTANDPEEGSVLVDRSLFRLPGSTDVDLQGISGSLVLARDSAGSKVVIVVFNTDALFDTGSATIGSTDTLDATIRLVNGRYPRSSIQVRGHTDATGTVSINQTLSERRAANVAEYLRVHGVNAGAITSTGLGSTQPLAEERTATGSVSAAGRQFNRRVEIVLRVP
jgi:outer membrane protein OmpA-like peptidoglycan-associated protein